MTNRDLAERIAQAVLLRGPVCAIADTVLDVLAETGHAFMRVVDDDAHVTLYRAMDDDAERMAVEAPQRARERQADLFGAKS